MKRACIVHDWVNIFLIPAISALTLAGLLGAIDPSRVTHAFLAYIVVDAVWVAVEPDAVPSLPRIILFHHAVTAALLAIPLVHPHMHKYTCVDGLVEINTFFLIARRCFPRWRKLLGYLYWASFIPMRCVLYPLMVPVLYYEMVAIGHAPWWHTAACVGSQVILCIFNFVLLYLSLAKRSRSRSGAVADKAGGSKAGKAAGSSGAAGVSHATVRLRAAATSK